METALLKLVGKLGIYLGIPSTALLSMFVMRFVNQSSVSQLQAPGAVLPNNNIELKTTRPANLLRLNKELEGKEKEESTNSKLISLDFPASTGFESVQKNVQVSKDATPNQHAEVLVHHNYSAGQTILKDDMGAHRSRKEIRFKQPPVPVQISGNKEQGSGGFNGYTLGEGKPDAGSAGDTESPGGHQLKPAQVVHALVLGDQKIRQGSIIKFRTQTPFMLNNRKVKPNTVFYASARFETDRLQLYVSKVGTGATQQTLHLVCRDEDDKEGIALHTGSGKWAEPAEAGKNAAVDELSSRLPLGRGIVSQLGHKLFQSGKQDEVNFSDGIELSFVESTD